MGARGQSIADCGPPSPKPAQQMAGKPASAGKLRRAKLRIADWKIRNPGSYASVLQCLFLCLMMAAAGCSSLGQPDGWSPPGAEPETERLPGKFEPLGPLVDIQWKESTTQWGVRPLFSVRQYHDVPLDQQAQFDVPFFAPAAVLSSLARPEVSVHTCRSWTRRTPPRTEPGQGRSGLQVLALYPLFMHESCGEQSRTVFLPLYYNVRNKGEELGRWHVWGFFPLYFGGTSDSTGQYHAVFPFGGVMKNVLGRDKVEFVMFPLYVHTTSGERESYNFLWPIVNFAHGGGRDAWRVWPLVGWSKRQDKPAQWFFLWPFSSFMEDPDASGERTAGGLSLFPVIGWRHEGNVSRLNVVWPLFSYARNKRTGRTDYVAPWPILRIGNGPDYYRRQVWPFFGYIEDGPVRRHYAMWPLYRHERRETDKSLMTGQSIFILYRSISNEWEVLEGRKRSDYENVLWPLWYYKRDGAGNTYFTTLELRGIPAPQGWDRFYSFIWRVFEHETRPGLVPESPENTWRSTRALWNMFRYDRDEDSSLLRVFPAFTARRSGPETRSLDVLMGLFGYSDKPGKRTYRVFFIPWTVDRNSGGSS